MADFIVACSARSIASSVVAKTRWRRWAVASCSCQAASRSAWPAICSASTRVGLDPGAGVRLVVAGALERRPPARGPRPRDARGRAAPWRSARAPRARSSSARSRARPRRAGRPASTAVPCRRARRAGRRAGRSGRRAPPRGRAGPRPRRGRAARSRSSWAFDFSSASTSSASISERPRSRRSISTSRSCAWFLTLRRSHSATPARTSPTTAMIPPMTWTAGPRSAMPRASSRTGPPASTIPIITSATEMRESGRQVGSGATSKSTSISSARIAFSSRIVLSRARRRSTPPRSTPTGLADGWLRGQGLDLGCGPRPPACSARSARWRRRARRRAARPGAPSRACSVARRGPPRPRRGGRVRRPACRGRVRAGPGRVSPCSSAAFACSTACSATLSRPGFRSPRVFRSWSARSSFLRARLVPRSAPLIEAWRRSRSAPSSRDRSLSSKWRTEAVERKKPSVGIPVSSAMTWSARVGSVIDLALVVEADRALRPGEGLLERADLLAVLVVLLELDGDDRAGLRRRSPRPEGFELRRGARRPAGQGELERSLDRRLAGLVRAADDREARGEVDVELAIAPEVLAATACGSSQGDLVPGEEQPAEAEGVALLGGLGRRAGGFELGDARLEVADERAGDRVGRRERTLGQGGDGDVADADLEERAARAPSRPRRGRGRGRRGGRRPGGRRGRGRGRSRAASCSTSAGWLATVAASSSAFSKRVRPTWRSRTVTVRAPAVVVELDEEDLAGAVLVERDRLRGAGVGVGRRCRPCPSGPSASGRARGSRGRSPRSRRW